MSAERYLVLPGVTGLWQVSGRSELDFDDLVRLDFLYLERWSILLGLSILIKQFPRWIFHAGAPTDTRTGPSPDGSAWSASSPVCPPPTGS